METQIKAFYKTPQGMKFVTIFGYSTKGIPSLEINGVSKLSKNMKEKMIFVTRTRRLIMPQRRFVICVEKNEIEEVHTQYLKCLEFPLLLIYWYLGGLLPISNLDDCITSGEIKSSGAIIHQTLPQDFLNLLKLELGDELGTDMKYIGHGHFQCLPLKSIESRLLLEHIPGLSFN